MMTATLHRHACLAPLLLPVEHLSLADDSNGEHAGSWFRRGARDGLVRRSARHGCRLQRIHPISSHSFTC